MRRWALLSQNETIVIRFFWLCCFTLTVHIFEWTNWASLQLSQMGNKHQTMRIFSLFDWKRQLLYFQWMIAGYSDKCFNKFGWLANFLCVSPLLRYYIDFDSDRSFTMPSNLSNKRKIIALYFCYFPYLPHLFVITTATTAQPMEK